MNSVTLLLVGNKGSGKSTTFDLIKEARPDAVEVQLAGHLKEVCSSVFEIPLNFFESQDLKEREMDSLAVLTLDRLNKIYSDFGLDVQGLPAVAFRQHVGRTFTTPRKIAQYVGTEILRAVKDSVHVDIAVAKARTSPLTVVTDCRFPNEVSGFVEAFPLSERTVSSVAIRRAKAEIAAGADPHPSEAHVRKIQETCQFQINNNNTMTDLRQQVETILRTVGALA